MKKVFILQGLPGAGKSSFTLWHLLEKYSHVAVCSADYYMVNDKHEYTFDPSRLGKVHGLCLQQFVEAVQGQEPVVVVDNTNLTAVEIAPYYALAQAYEYEIVIQPVNTHLTPEVCAESNVHGVPLSTLVRMAETLAAFTPPPWWEVAEPINNR